MFFLPFHLILYSFAYLDSIKIQELSEQSSIRIYDESTSRGIRLLTSMDTMRYSRLTFIDVCAPEFEIPIDDLPVVMR